MKWWWLVALSVVVYLPSWFNGFVWDDEEQIVNNPFVKDFGHFGSVFAGSTFGGGGTSLPAGGYYKPLMSVWYMLNYALFGDWAGGYHLSQSLLHGVNAGLVYLIIRRIRRFGRSGEAGAASDKVAFLAAMIWLVHPGNVESVAYAASAQEVLASFFGLLAVWLVVARKQLFKDEIAGLFAADGLILLSLLSKEAGAVFPLVISAYLLIVERERRSTKHLWLMLLPMVLGYAVLRFGVAKIAVEPNTIIPVAQLTLGERMLTVVETLWQHIRVTLMPAYLYIGHHQVVTNFSWRTIWQLIVIFGLLVSMVMTNIRTKSKQGWFFWVWLILATGLVSNIYPLDMTYAERWSYMPIAAMVGWLAVMGGGWFGRLGEGGRFRRFRRIGRIGAGVVVMLLIGRNMVRQMDWHDGLRLYGHDIQYAKNAFDLENNYGVELMRANRIEEAKVHFERSMELSPKWWTPPNNLGVVYQRSGDMDKAKELYRLSIKNGNYFLAYENLAAILVNENDPGAVEIVAEGLKRFPYNQNLLELAYYLSSK